MYAAMNGLSREVELLAKEGKADVNHFDRFQRTALHWACRFDSCKVAEVLLNMKANPNARDIEQLTPVMLAKNYNNNEVASIITNYAANKKHERERRKKQKEERDKQERERARKEEEHK